MAGILRSLTIPRRAGESGGRLEGGQMMRELAIGWADAWLTIVTATGIYLTMVLLSRVFGQRQFSTASSYDLAFIFALGSLVGRVILVRTTLAAAVLGLLTMFVLHWATGWLHHNIGVIHRAIQNRPILVLAQGKVLEENLRKAKTSVIEVHAQLRLRGLASLEEAQAVVLERNGEFSVISHDRSLDASVFQEVIGSERLKELSV